MTARTMIFVFPGTALFLFGSVLFAYSIKQFSPAKKEPLRTGGNECMSNLLKANKFETGLIMFISLSLLNIIIIYLKESAIK